MQTINRTEIVVITGLDGSGKSSVFQLLKKSSSAEIILVPSISLEGLESAPELYNASKFVNTINLQADEQKSIELKSLALFASMLLFRKLVEHKSKTSKTIYCERHPLIDTNVYAQFYAAKLAPDKLDSSKLNGIESEHKVELSYINSLLPNALQARNKKISKHILNLIYQKLHLENRTQTADFEHLFQVTLPKQVYYLKASPEVLFQRIQQRGQLEVHETFETLQKLSLVYNQLLDQLDVPVQIIDTTQNTAEDIVNKHFADE